MSPADFFRPRLMGDTELQLLATALDTDDRTAHLVYADELAERDPVQAMLYRIAVDPENDDWRLDYANHLTASDPERAEFVRLQCDPILRDPFDMLTRHEYLELRARIGDLRKKHDEAWVRVKCPHCDRGNPNKWDHKPGGSTRMSATCEHCNGTGDIGGLGPWTSPPGERNAYPYRTDFGRGFPVEVVGPRLTDLFMYSTGTMHYPMPWAVRVLTHHPTLRKITTQAEPTESMWTTKPHAWGWINDIHTSSNFERSKIPEPLLKRLPDDGVGESGTHTWKWFKTRERALDALATVIADFVRDAIRDTRRQQVAAELQRRTT